MSLEDRLAPFIELRRLEADGAAFETHSSTLQPVRYKSRAAMLKLIKFEDEENGPSALAHFAGDVAVSLLAHEGWAQVTERASGGDLSDMFRADDDAAFEIVCDTLARLHAPRPIAAPATLIPMRRRFRALFEGCGRSSVYELAAQIAERLIAAPRNEGVLHGDINPTNILWDDARGWLAIDPKGVYGERAYDYAYALMNPIETAIAPGRLERHAQTVSARTGMSTRRLLEFAVASSALSTLWWIESGHPNTASTGTERALAALTNCVVD